LAHSSDLHVVPTEPDDAARLELVGLGLTPAEAAATVALVQFGPQTAAQVSQHAGLSRQHAHRVLNTLTMRGVIDQLPGAAARWVVPAEADNLVARVIEEHRRRLDEAQAHAGPLLTALAGLDRLGIIPTPDVQVLQNQNEAIDAFQGLVDSAEYEILGISKPPIVTGDWGRGVVERLRAGVTVKGLEDRALMQPPHGQTVEGALRRQVQAGAEIRLHDQLPMKLLVVDRRLSWFSVENPADVRYPTILRIDAPGVANAFRLAFEKLWPGGTDLGAGESKQNGRVMPARARSATR